MGDIEDKLKEFSENQSKDFFDEVEEIEEGVDDLKSSVKVLEEKIDELYKQRKQNSKQEDTDSEVGEAGTQKSQNIASTLKSIRDRFEITQNQLADLLDVSSATISSWETGKTKPSKSNADKIETISNKSKEEIEESLDDNGGLHQLLEPISSQSRDDDSD